jgi:hypothetical protein
VGRRLSISLGKQATVFQAEVYAILTSVHAKTQDRPGQRNTLVWTLIVRWL